MLPGVEKLQSTNLNACDLRASASLILAANIAHGTSTIFNIHHIERGYMYIEEKNEQTFS